MPVVVAGCLDFIEQLRRYTKGFKYELLVNRYVRQIGLAQFVLYCLKKPPSVSPIQFYLNNSKIQYNDSLWCDDLFIKVKKHNEPLRIIKFSFSNIDCKAYIDYFTAEGFKQTTKSHRRWDRWDRFRDLPEFTDYHALILQRFTRVTYNQGDPVIIHSDLWDISSEEINTKLLMIIRDVLMVSLKPKVKQLLPIWSLRPTGIDTSGKIVLYDIRTRTIKKHAR